jgi:predicted glutamine amidotransferase
MPTAVKPSTNQSVALAASVPLNDEAWSDFAKGEVIALRDGLIVARRAKEQALTPVGAS